MTEKNSKESFKTIAVDIKKRITISNYYYVILIKSNSLTSGLFSVDNNETEYRNETVDIFKSFSDRLWLENVENGIWIVQSGSDEIIHLAEYNPELSSSDLLNFVLFQEFSIKPKSSEDQEKLKQSIKKEKIKNTLVYSCYINDHDEILKRVKTASIASLNQTLKYAGTPLGLCTENNFLEGFSAIAKAGADLSKLSITGRPIELALKYSPSIALYIIENHREIFDEATKKRGFSLAVSTKDKEILQAILDSGCDIKGKDLNFPTLHNFADFNNITGLQFALENGFDINFKNKKGQTALDRAKTKEHKEAIEFLITHGAT